MSSPSSLLPPRASLTLTNTSLLPPVFLSHPSPTHSLFLVPLVASPQQLLSFLLPPSSSTRSLQVVEFACGAASFMMGETLENVSK
eukprot:766233-Hanusia_phi.AAC.7